jgi:hypothetical protein
MPFDEAHEYRQRRPPDVELVSVQLDAGRAAAPQNDFCESNEFASRMAPELESCCLVRMEFSRLGRAVSAFGHACCGVHPA